MAACRGVSPVGRGAAAAKRRRKEDAKTFKMGRRPFLVLACEERTEEFEARYASDFSRQRSLTAFYRERIRFPRNSDPRLRNGKRASLLPTVQFIALDEDQTQYDQRTILAHC